MKPITTAIFALLMIPAFALAQINGNNDLESNWEFEGVFPDSSLMGALQGITATPNDEVWVLHWNLDGRSQFVVYDLHEGTALDTIGSATAGGDTFEFPNNSGRGATVGPDGNVFASIGNRMIIFDYETREAINWFFPDGDDAGPLTGPSVSDDGFILASFILSANPIQIFDSELNQVNVVTAEKEGVSRYSVISPDGNWVFDFPLNEDDFSIRAWNSPFGPEGEYSLVSDNFGARLNVQSAAIDRKTNHLIVSAGDESGERPHDPDFEGLTWYFLDYDNEEFVDYVSWQLNEDSDTSAVAPRGVTTSWDGEYILLASFDFGSEPSIQKFKRTELPTSADELHVDRPEGYALEQNYPNPFNPVTQITFTIPESSMITLQVYDQLGRQVATLVNEGRSAGTYTEMFDASGLSSGMYIYRLEANGHQLTRQMMLVK